MEQGDPTLVALDLPNHMMGGVSQNLIDALFIPRTELASNGLIRTRYIVSRAAEETHREYTLSYPMGLIFSPALDIARERPDCARDYFATYLCPEDSQYEHMIVFSRGRLSSPVETEDFITVDDTNAFGEQSTMLIERRMLKFNIAGAEIAAAQATEGYAVAVGSPECAGCEGDKLYQDIVVGGGDGLAAPEVAVSTDAGVTFTTVTVTGATIAYYCMAAWRKGDVIVLALADDPDPATATVGEVAVSQDGGTNWDIIAAITNAMFAVGAQGDEVVVAGADGEIWKTADYVNWTQLSSPTAFSTLHFTDFAYDEEEKVGYLSATGGGAASLEGNDVGDITAAVNAGANDLNAVVSLAPGHVAFGGASGLLRESTDSANTFATKSVASTTNDIKALSGSKYRLCVAAGSTVYERSQMTGMLFQEMTLRFGQTYGGVVNALAMPIGVNADNFILSIDATGDVYIYRPRYPGA
jgi:hypothetical protein